VTLKDPLDVERTLSCGHTYTLRHTACPTCFAQVKAEGQALAKALQGLWDNTGTLLAEIENECDLPATRKVVGESRAEAEVALAAWNRP